MMKFRRLYWVTESVSTNSSSEITGVFTSIPDLIENCISARPTGSANEGLRISLVELDVLGSPLAHWQHPSFNSIAGDLETYVKNGEMTVDEVTRLTEALKKANV